jgi:hypothetical protein
LKTRAHLTHSWGLLTRSGTMGNTSIGHKEKEQGVHQFGMRIRARRPMTEAFRR